MYLNMISSSCAFLPIDKHTRVIGNSRSIIMLLQMISLIQFFSCVFQSDISNHFPIGIIVERKNKKQDNIR